MLSGASLWVVRKFIMTYTHLHKRSIPMPNSVGRTWAWYDTDEDLTRPKISPVTLALIVP